MAERKGVVWPGLPPCRRASARRRPHGAIEPILYTSKRRPEGQRQGGSPGHTIGRRSGQATLEFALLYAAVIVPLTFGIVFVAEMYWVWHSMVEFTRDGARYAAAHCWQPDGENVISYMEAHIPLTIDLNQFQDGGTAQIVVQYFSRDPDSGQLTAFSCSGSCSVSCVPDSVTITVTNYQFQRFVGYLKLPPVVMPAFPTSMPIESNGCDPEQNVCNP